MMNVNKMVKNVNEMLNDAFKGIAIACVTGNGDIVVQVESKFANRVRVMMELKFSDKLTQVRTIKADGNTMMVFAL